MQKKVKIAFFCPNLGGGGAEMHLTRLIKYLDKEHFDITLILSRKGGQYISMIPEVVKVIYLKSGQIGSGVAGLLSTITPLAEVLKSTDPHIFCSIMDHANMISYLAHKKAGVNAKLVFCIQTPILQGLKFNWNLFNKVISLFIPIVYPKADLIIALSEGVKNDMVGLDKKLERKVTVINNIGIEDNIVGVSQDEPTSSRRGKFVLTVCGRIIKLKGFDTVIRALAIVREKHDTDLWIIGEGPEKDNLKTLAGSLGIEKSVHFHGFKSNPQEYIRQSDIFVLSSHYEGFGNVIVEAMAVGTPVVSTDCPYGPGEIITDGKNGMLVPVGDHVAMGEAIIELLNDQTLRASLSKNGLKRSEDFSGDKIAALYADSFIKLTNAEED